jgi:ABC-2 type transport system ATP-binding protein
LSAPEQQRAPALSVEHLTKRFGDRIAFSDVSFEVGQGEVFGFLGPNGAGKTTTVRTLSTLIAPTSGSATVAGVPLDPKRGVEIRQRIAVMPEAPGLYLKLSVAENLECFAGLYEAEDPAERIDSALHAVGLADRAGDPCGALSKGLRQRVALARALLAGSGAILMDDPLSAVDTETERTLLRTVGPALRGRTVLVATQRLSTVALADRAVVLRDGKLVEQGTPEELAALGGDFTALFGDETRAA